MSIKSIAMAAGLILLGLAFWWLFIAETPLPPVVHPETGYRVTDAADIESIWIIEYPTAEVHRGRYEVARQYWDEILRNLSPSERDDLMSGDPTEPPEPSPAFSLLGTLRLALGSGSKVVIDLYDVGSSLIFCVRGTTPHVYYHAGARGAAMTQVLADAFAHSRLKSEDPPATAPIELPMQ